MPGTCCDGRDDWFDVCEGQGNLLPAFWLPGAPHRQAGCRDDPICLVEIAVLQTHCSIGPSGLGVDLFCCARDRKLSQRQAATTTQRHKHKKLIPGPSQRPHTGAIPAGHAVPTKRRAGGLAAWGRPGRCVYADHRSGRRGGVGAGRAGTAARTGIAHPERGTARCVRRNTRSCEAAFASSITKQGAQALGAKAASQRETASTGLARGALGAGRTQQKGRSDGPALRTRSFHVQIDSALSPPPP